MKYNTVQSDGGLEVTLCDQLTFADHAAFRGIIDNLVETGAQSCVLDLKELNSVDSAGLGMFMIAHEECERNDSKLVLRGAQGQVKRMLELARFDSILTMQE